MAVSSLQVCRRLVAGAVDAVFVNPGLAPSSHGQQPANGVAGNSESGPLARAGMSSQRQHFLGEVRGSEIASATRLWRAP